jgi:hypothetical protein
LIERARRNYYGATQPRKTDNTLIKALGRAFRWKRMLESGEFATIAELAEREGGVMCGRIWTPPDFNGLVGSGLGITIADVYPSSSRGPIHRRPEPRWVSARLSLNGSKA